MEIILIQLNKKKMKLNSIYGAKNLSILFMAIVFAAGCKKTPKGDTQIYPLPDPPGTYAKGADVSWVSEMEAGGKKFYNSAGVQQDLFKILSDKGINSIRLRVWVNPSSGWCNTADVLAKAKRGKAMNMRILVDFHYSDTWADPGQQTKPAAWMSQDITALKTSVYNHTVDVLTTLKNNKIIPEWVQVGNETNNGMLWEEGKASLSMKNFADLVLSGYNAVKSVSPSSKVIVHLSNGYDNSLFRWMFDGLKSNGAKWDVIGMSLYPSATDWATKNTQCLANMTDMISRYGSEIMICEVGMPVAEAAASKSFIADLLAKTKALPNQKGLGVFYWEPESYNSWNGYKLGAFDDTGKPTVALDAFLP
jgi:arabinogalactan endo-1,4-beta-galactosidase